MSNPISDVLPDDYIQALAEAAAKGQLMLLLVLEDEQLDALRHGRPGLLKLSNGGAVALVTSSMVKRAYGNGGVH